MIVKPLSPSSTTSPELEIDTQDQQRTECLALVLVWSAREPRRVGETALLHPDIPVYILGRAPSLTCEESETPSGPAGQLDSGSQVTPSDEALLELEVKGEPVTFFRQRPEGTRDAGLPEKGSSSLLGECLSRRQLAIFVEQDSLLVRNIGRCRMSVNGQVVREATVRPGDTIYLRHQVLLYCTHRPLQMPALKAYPFDRVPAFGEPDRDGMIGESPTMWKLRDRVAASARTSYHVLVVGESGSGKELAAQAVHHLSARSQRKLIADNIAAIPPSLAAALLFGNKKNFPNPGMEERAGLLGSANGSSLFLDEIGDMPEEVQPMFLRVTERKGEYFRLGEESKLQRSDFRLIGATNRPEKMRYELKRRFQREIRVPGVNHRKEDIPLLIRHLLKIQADTDDLDASRFIVNGYPKVHPLLIEQLIHHTYHTNVSEIMFLLGQAMAESDHDMIMPLGASIRIESSNRSVRSESVRRSAPRPLPTVEEVKRALSVHKGHITRTANALNISRDQLNRLIRREGISISTPKQTR
jgi:two-component system response regulator HydG